MDNKLIKQIVELEDEINYLRTLIEYADEEGINIETVIYNKLEYLQNELDKLEEEV